MNEERLYQVLMGPHVSEKSAIGSQLNNQYVFKVLPTATKLEVRAAVEKLFNVKVENVTTSNVKGKVKRNRHGLSQRASWKKAVVRLSEGHDIDFGVAQ